MIWFTRTLQEMLNQALSFGKSILLFGPRQTGKTSLVKSIPHDLYINLMDPNNLRKYEVASGVLIEEIKALCLMMTKSPLIIIDEIQKVPNLTDSIQILIDEKIATFILTGSSARKIKNLLPGRVLRYEMTPLSIKELTSNNTHTLALEERLVNGSLPEILVMSNQAQIDLQLNTYVNVYLEEEIRKEALVRNVGAFSNFLRLACIESGNIANFNKLSQEIGVAHNTISDYYGILNDCMVVEKIEPLSKGSQRRRLTKSAKYILFDLGVRRIGALEPVNPTIKQKSELFEQFIGLELRKLMLENSLNGQLLFWRDHAGPEVDYVIEYSGYYIPVEVKLTNSPKSKDIRHLLTFKNEYKNVKYAFVVCRIDIPRILTENVIALPWQQLAKVFQGF
ncbi:MAG: hypothetical protein A3F18_01935 [Legionellales bacterium RIFCSPHIGHO2_12_FULL_37_14]|nr:MAG: hypothetical protein A3F18_01935 [Legionellales bacterium RIFCSPHIGHO2_12_FULL_37_14]